MLGHCQAYELQVYGLQAYKTKTKTKREAKIKNEKRTKMNKEKEMAKRYFKNSRDLWGIISIQVKDRMTHRMSSQKNKNLEMEEYSSEHSK